MKNFDLNEWMKNNRMVSIPEMCNTLHCADGFTMSVQASEFHYCEPRINNAEEYSSVEVGYPSKPEPILYFPYGEEGNISDVYGWVPVSVIENIVEKHGGIK